MAFNRLSFLIIFIPIVIGINTTKSKVGTAVNNSDTVTVTHNTTLPKVVNNLLTDLPIPIMTEGGSIGTNQTVAAAAKENNTTLLVKLQTDPLQDIPTDIKGPAETKGNSVVGRKGVQFKEEASAAEHKPENPIDVKAISTKAPEASTKTTVTSKSTTNPVRLQPEKEKIVSTTPVPHKPTVLSYGALQSTDDKILSLLEEGLKRKQAPNPGSHPGMVMPVVITVLVVPMFAALGYMALKRGQEAWKNRHYKRMDFLLDGMYND